MIEAAIESVLTNPLALAVWIFLDAVAVVILAHDLETTNTEIAPLMKLVWLLTVLYSGPLGLAIYWYTGRPTIAHDSVWRRGARSTAHCYSGCGAGEVLGVTVAAGLLALETATVAGITFVSAYVFGVALTVGPLMQEGIGFREALADAVYAETPSIVVMEVVAIGVDLWLAGEATIGEPLFWSALIFSMSIGYWAAYPINVALVEMGVKEGMQSPKVQHSKPQQSTGG